MADINYTSDRDPNLTTQELEIIGYFAQGQKRSISSRNLKLEFTETSIRLSASNGKLIGISKQTNEWQRKVLVANDSIYRQQIIETLLGRGYITRQRSSHPDFSEHHHYRVPKGYQLHYTETIQLWRAWWHDKRDRLNAPNTSIDMPIFTKGNWYPVRDLQPKQGNFTIQTAIGAMNCAPEDYVVWLDRSSTSAVHSAVRTAINPQASTSTPAQSRSVAASEPSASLADIDLESYLNTFDTENTGDIDRIEGIYNISELLSSISSVSMDEDSTPTVTPSTPSEAPETVTPSEPQSSDPAAALASTSTLVERPRSLKHKAIDVLANYLQEGDLVTLTEVVKNADGSEIERKVTTIQKGCPKWAIELIQKLD
jgi:hypothetical protein